MNAQLKQTLRKTIPITATPSSISDLVRILHVSDVHLFHPNNDTVEIISKLEPMVFRTDVDIIMLGGDLFHTIASLANEPVWPVLAFASRLLRHCAKHNILLRVLKGTPSHDWNQNRIFTVMANATQTQHILRVVDDIEIEYIERHDIHVLYIPDECRDTPVLILADVMAELARLNLSQVDVGLFHGAFDYQLPISPEHLHCSATYSKLVKYFISIGHVHVRSLYLNIIAQGGFDRTTHGDETAKGLHISTIDKRAQAWSTEFVENTQAKTFKTINVDNVPLEQALIACEKVAGQVPKGSYLRILAHSTSPIYQGLNVVQNTFPDFVWSKKNSDKGAKKSVSVDMSKPISTIQITKDNLSAMLAERIQAKHPFTFSKELIESTLSRHL